MQLFALPHLMGIKRTDMENKISIPKPCHEDWNAMLPEEQGRFCLSCSKTVIDFSSWEPEAILDYLRHRKEERVCGRFNTEQVEALPPKEDLLNRVVRAHMPLLRKIAAVIVLSFGLLYAGESHAQQSFPLGKVRVVDQAVPQGQVATRDTVAVADTTRPDPQIMGMIALPPKPPKAPKTGHKPVQQKAVKEKAVLQMKK